jgi:hypothetical protein
MRMATEMCELNVYNVVQRRVTNISLVVGGESIMDGQRKRS